MDNNQNNMGQNGYYNNDSYYTNNGYNDSYNNASYTQEKRAQLITALFNAVKGFEYKSFCFKFQMLQY